jgi:hypothetical protein
MFNDHLFFMLNQVIFLSSSLSYNKIWFEYKSILTKLKPEISELFIS